MTRLFTTMTIFYVGLINFICASEKIQINDRELELTDQNKTFSYTLHAQATNIALKISDHQLQIGTFKDDNVEHASNIYRCMLDQKEQLNPFNFIKNIEFISSQEQSLNNALLQGENILLSSKRCLNIVNTIAEGSKTATFTSPKIVTCNLFFSTATKLTFCAPEDSTHWLKKIEYTSSSSSDLPFHYMVVGNLEFNPPATQGYLVVIGAKKAIFTVRKSVEL